MGAFEVIGVLGSVASLIGLSKQLYDSASNAYPGEAGKYIGLYVAVTDLTSAWKKAHHRYHSNFKDLEMIRRAMFADDGDMRRPGYIAPALLRRKFKEQPNLGVSLRGFKKDVDHDLRQVTQNIGNSDNMKNALDQIRKKVPTAFARTLEDIRYQEDKFFIAHSSVCIYFDKLAPMIKKSEWDHDEVEQIVGGFENFFDDQQECIMMSDSILLNSISLFEMITPSGVNGSA